MAVQGKINKLQTQFDKKTERLISEQAESLGVARKSLENDIKQLKGTVASLKSDVTGLTTKRNDLDKNISDAKESLKVTNEAVEAAHRDVVELSISVMHIKDDIVSYSSEKSALETRVSVLIDQEHDLKESIAVLQATMDKKQKLVDALEAKYTDKVAEKEKTIKHLDAKVLDATQQLDEIKKEEITIRNDLAVWKRALDEQDKNLRIREAKVTMGEDKLINNANLLNL